MGRGRALLTLAAGAIVLVVASRSDAAFTFDCPFGGFGDPIDRAFFVTNYAGTTLDQVGLAHRSLGPPAQRTIALTARLDTFDGTFLGVASVTRTIGSTMSISVFDFGHIPVPAGSTIAFTQALVNGPSGVVFDVGSGPCPNIIETGDATPPLSTYRRDTVGLVTTGDPQSIASAMNLDCPYAVDGSRDVVTRGFYVPSYRGTTIDVVRMRHSADVDGARTLTLAARLGTYDGPLLGTASITRDLTTGNTESVYDFGDIPVPAGARVAFVETLTSGDAPVYRDTGMEDCDVVVETTDQAPPLSTPIANRTGLKIVGRVGSGATRAVIEYYHTGIGHYFMTADPDEIFGLDHGAYGGVFVRTGRQFLVPDGPLPGTSDVCRFFTVAYAPLGSHFYTADPAECELVKANPNWEYEKIAFFVAVPNGGVCGAGLVPVYRAFNNGMTGAPNHRFFTDVTLYNEFTATQGWAAEGVRFCAIAPP